HATGFSGRPTTLPRSDCRNCVTLDAVRFSTRLRRSEVRVREHITPRDEQSITAIFQQQSACRLRSAKCSTAQRLTQESTHHGSTRTIVSSAKDLASEAHWSPLRRDCATKLNDCSINFAARVRRRRRACGDLLACF